MTSPTASSRYAHGHMSAHSPPAPSDSEERHNTPAHPAPPVPEPCLQSRHIPCPPNAKALTGKKSREEHDNRQTSCKHLFGHFSSHGILLCFIFIFFTTLFISLLLCAEAGMRTHSKTNGQFYFSRFSCPDAAFSMALRNIRHMRKSLRSDCGTAPPVPVQRAHISHMYRGCCTAPEEQRAARPQTAGYGRHCVGADTQWKQSAATRRREGRHRFGDFQKFSLKGNISHAARTYHRMTL